MKEKKIQVELSEGKDRFSDRVYDFLSLVSVRVSDTVVVDTRYGPQLGRVVSCKQTTPITPNKYVICRVDVYGHQKLMRGIERSLEIKTKINELQAEYKLLTGEEI